MQSIDLHQFFDCVWPQALAKHKAAALRSKARYQLIVTGERGGAWAIDLTQAEPRVSPGVGAQAACTITVPDTVLRKALASSNPAHAVLAAFFAGALTATGIKLLVVPFASLLTLRP